MKHKILLAFVLIAATAIVFNSCDKEFSTVNENDNAISKQFQKEGLPTNDPEITYILVDTNMLHYDGVVRHVTGFYVLENNVIVSGVIYVDDNLVWEFSLPPDTQIEPTYMYHSCDYNVVIHPSELELECFYKTLDCILDNHYNN